MRIATALAATEVAIGRWSDLSRLWCQSPLALLAIAVVAVAVAVVAAVVAVFFLLLLSLAKQTFVTTYACPPLHHVYSVNCHPAGA